MQQPDFSTSKILPEIELTAPGRHVGQFSLLWSTNENPLGVHPIPAMCLVGGPGPTVVLTAGVHGDEYEGPVALTRLFQALEPGDLAGRLIFLPMLNAPAMRAGTRTSPLDGGNLNRAFPGDPAGTPTAQIAHLLKACLMPVADAVIDLHSGGKASWFLPCALAARSLSGPIDPANLALARAFGTDTIWVLGAANDAGSVNGGATRARVPCIAAELGGGGAVGIGPLATAETGLGRCLIHLGLVAGVLPDLPPPRLVEITAPTARITAPRAGLYQPVKTVGQDIAAGETLGWILTPDSPDTPPLAIRARSPGLILAETRRAAVVPGDFLALVPGPPL